MLVWFDANGRDLPWRHDTDPWRVLVTEVMSHQTQIARVSERRGPFLDRFPTPASLADATPGEAIDMWAGLGYLRRLHHLRRAAATIANDGWPDDLTDLPGVGPYTAAAVECFAFGRAVPAVDTNHKRVLSRWDGTALDGAALAKVARRELDRDRPREWNQAVMDLGAMICGPRPACPVCPVSQWCADPSIYEPPPRQSSYPGSLRQVRAAILKELIRGPLAQETLTTLHGSQTPTALADLAAGGQVVKSVDSWRLI